MDALVSEQDGTGLMEVLFESERLRAVCSDQRQLLARFGKVCAKKITLRLQQLAATGTLEDMRSLPGRCHELTDDRKGQLAVDVEHPRRLVFRPTSNPAPAKPDGGLDWKAVESVTVIEIEDYH